MAIFIPQLNQTVNQESGQSLFESLKKHSIPVASSCGGQGICGKCVVEITSRTPIPPESAEERQLKQRMNIPAEFRLSCQLHVDEDCEVRTTYW